MTNFSALKNQAEYLLAKLEHGKGYKIAELSQRLNTAADENPSDIVIVSVARIIEKLSNKDPSGIITQGELEDVYQQLVGLNTNTRFREVLGEFLRSNKNEPELTNEAFINSIRNPADGEIKIEGDEELNSLFEPRKETYNAHNASKAQEKVELELRALGISNPHVKLEGGDANFLVFSAQLDTNRGAIPVYIPTKASGDEFPSVFVGLNDLEKLSYKNLSEYVKTASTNKYCLQEVLEKSDIKLPNVEVPKELKALTSNIEESVLETSVGYPQASVRMAKRMIIAELGSMGFKNSQVRVSSPTNDGFICEATLDTPKGKMNIEVPVEMSGNSPLLPSVFAKDDYVADFNAANIQSLVLKEAGYVDGGIRNDSELYAMSLNELKDTINKSAVKGNFDVCDEAIEVIANRFDEDTYRNIVADYRSLLVSLGNNQDIIRQAHEDKDQFIKTSNSLYPVHKKLGLPVNQLIRDENGVWHRKSSYRRNDDDSIKTFFSNSKILLGD